ncbi:hypothetical protein [Nocardioides bizhenqiangii]|uniref:Uncharacterized protein n=1 Tax=Nocardioides bizhenqiangii TaxID=3095076 RepID=A0ABZ0ZPI4_9ACTN|nr:hypothetical protein [Nocardioides sp. HM61]WQQ26152.1 hypothetical protein SHK19_19590 [Nocardioides sp. HM61]
MTPGSIDQITSRLGDQLNHTVEIVVESRMVQRASTVDRDLLDQEGRVLGTSGLLGDTSDPALL